MDYRQILTFEPGKTRGKAWIRDTRISVTDVLDRLRTGMTDEEVIADFPALTKDDIQACLQYAADREQSMISRAISA